MQGYDAWKLDNGVNPEAERLGDACRDAEDTLEWHLKRVIEQANAASDFQWELSEVLADVEDDGEVYAEVSLRIGGLLCDSRMSQVPDLAENLTALGAALAKLAREQQAAEDLSRRKMAPSAQSRSGAARRQIS